MNINWKQLGKMVIRGVATACVGAVIDNVVGFTTPVDASKLNRVATKVGGYILSGMVGEKAGEYIDDQISTFFKTEEEVEDGKEQD